MGQKKEEERNAVVKSQVDFHTTPLEEKHTVDETILLRWILTFIETKKVLCAGRGKREQKEPSVYLHGFHDSCLGGGSF